MTTSATTVIGGIDTHKHTHYAAVIDEHGRLLGHHEFPAHDRGYRELLTWMRSYGQLEAVGRGEHRILRRHPDSLADHVRAAGHRGEPAQPTGSPDGRQVRPAGRRA